MPRERRPVVQRLRWVWAGAASRKKKKGQGRWGRLSGTVWGCPGHDGRHTRPGLPRDPKHAGRRHKVGFHRAGSGRGGAGGCRRPGAAEHTGVVCLPSPVGQGAFFRSPPSQPLGPALFSLLVRPFPPRNEKVCPSIHFINSGAPTSAAPPCLCVQNVACCNGQAGAGGAALVAG